MNRLKHCECDVPAPFTREELTHDVVEALLGEWGHVPQPGPDQVCKTCRLVIDEE